MLLKQTVHFQTRMAERSFSFDHVKKAISDPDSTEEILEEKIKVTKEIEGKTIVVVYLKERFRRQEETILLITAYYIQP